MGDEIEDWVDITALGEWFETQYSPSTNQRRYRQVNPRAFEPGRATGHGPWLSEPPK